MCFDRSSAKNDANRSKMQQKVTLDAGLEMGRLLKYLVVGGLNTVVSYVVYACLYFLTNSYVVAVCLTTVFGIVFNFYTTGRFVFKNKKNILFFKFMTVYGIGAGLNILIIRLLELEGINAYFSGAIAAIPLALFSFVMFRVFVFIPTHSN